MDEKVILLVDDNRDLIRITGKKLKEAFPNFSISIATNGKSGIEAAKMIKPDIIIMDWDMPIKNGLEATQELRSHEDTASIPIIIATGKMISSVHLKEALEAGAIDYIKKPIDYIELVARMDVAFRLKEQEEFIQSLFQKNLDTQVRKLTSSSMLLLEKNSMLKNYYNSLNDIESQLEKGKKESPIEAIQSSLQQIKTLKHSIKEQFELDDSWLAFKKHFEEVNPTFFKTLGEHFGKLTAKDLKLCAYLKLGMEIKEMANILHISPGSIRTAIYRLKKKVDLGVDDNFRMFIMRL